MCADQLAWTGYSAASSGSRTGLPPIGDRGPISVLLRRRHPSRLIQSANEGEIRATHHSSRAIGVISTRPRLRRIAAMALSATRSALVHVQAGSFARFLARLDMKVSTIGVRTKPGHNAVTPKPLRLYSERRAAVNPTSPNLLV